MIRRRRTASVSFAGSRFPPDVILLAVRRYLRYGLSYRDVEELLAERGVEVDHVSIYRWVQRLTALVIDAARQCRHSVGDRVGRSVHNALDAYINVCANRPDPPQAEHEEDSTRNEPNPIM